MEQLSKRLMSWASILEPKTREQAERASAMPFIYPHLALMPDAHLGLGATVGSVIPTLGAIMPAAVGVDIGCFRGDTRIPLLSGTQMSLRDMAEAGGFWWVYSLDSAGQIVPGKALALKTRENAELMRIVVSGGDEIICTPDHQFMLTDGTYREARDLRFNESLMPFHKNHIHFDNTPENLEALDAGEHSRYHRTVGHSFANASPEFQALAGHNHKVISAEHISERADVYCLKVEGYHNFALAAGVFVHNCGMMAVRTQFTADDARRRGELGQLRAAIEREVPLSAGKHNRAIRDEHTEASIAVLEQWDGADSAEKIAPNWRLQLGSLGSGNHFIEVSLDEDDRIWLFLHSGSRGVGNKLATKHIKIAQDQCHRKSISLPDRDLAYLVEDEPEFWAYIRDLRWAQHFALLNRAEMMHRVEQCFEEWLGAGIDEGCEEVNCHHNYTAQETHFDKEVWLSRKGAIDASAGKPGLIPGSMGTRSYVVEGKGNRLALNSSPHGAGREYSRTAARKKFTRSDLEAAMQGIEWRHTDAFLDEIPGAYKDVDVVMADAAELVEVKHTLRQIVNVKGD
jgi:tRNA-splicing ligase RtcB (3'-phosphate/5'-hydroxy nucleic acid ligase)